MEISLSVENYNNFCGCLLGFGLVFFPEYHNNKVQYCVCKSTDEAWLPLI